MYFLQFLLTFTNTQNAEIKNCILSYFASILHGQKNSSFPSKSPAEQSNPSTPLSTRFHINENISDTLLIPFRLGVCAKYFHLRKLASRVSRCNCEKGESSRAGTQSCRGKCTITEQTKTEINFFLIPLMLPFITLVFGRKFHIGEKMSCEKMRQKANSSSHRAEKKTCWLSIHISFDAPKLIEPVTKIQTSHFTFHFFLSFAIRFIIARNRKETLHLA